MSDISVGYAVSTFADYLNIGTPLTPAKLSLRFTRYTPRNTLTGLKYKVGILILATPR